jgi:hypothetical protein
MTATADLAERVTRLETSVTSIGADLQEVREGQTALGDKIDRLATSLTSTDGRAAERAQAVKAEIREESERKARDRSELFKSGLSLIGAIAIVVTALGGPYVAKIDQTSGATVEATRAIGELRAIDAQQSAEIARNRDSAEIGRERNRIQDEKLTTQGERISALEARGGQ